MWMGVVLSSNLQKGYELSFQQSLIINPLKLYKGCFNFINALIIIHMDDVAFGAKDFPDVFGEKSYFIIFTVML